MDKKFVLLTTIFFLSFSIFFSMMILNRPLGKLIRAREELTPSEKKSLIFAWPLSVVADGKTQVDINVFIRNNNGLPLVNKKVTLSTNLGQIKDIQSTTDKNGKAHFILSSNKPGNAQIIAKVDNQIELIQKLIIKFE